MSGLLMICVPGNVYIPDIYIVSHIVFPDKSGPTARHNLGVALTKFHCDHEAIQS